MTRNTPQQSNQKYNKGQNSNPISHNYETDYSRKGASYGNQNQSNIVVNNGQQFGMTEKRNPIKPK